MAAGFMAGFGTTLSNLIEEDRKYYRDAAAKRRDYIQTYGTRAVVEIENQANAAMGTMNYLISNGIPKEDVRYVLDTSGVQGIAQLKATLDSRDDLTKEEKTQLVKKAKDYVTKNPDEDLNTIVKRAYGLYKSESNPVKRERSMFASMLGLDSKMMEDDVLDDMYINGMTGRDIYRIMGSAGPKAGAPLDLNLPAKAPSPTILNNTAKFLESQFDTSISSRIEALKRSQLVKDKDGNSVAAPDFDKIQSEITKLENLKAKGLLGLGQYATEYDPSLFNFARAQEDALPGAITRNSYLFEFLPAYKTYFEEAVDDAKIDAADGKSKGKPETPPSDNVIKFETEQAAIDAAEKGELKEGQKIQVGNKPPVVFKPKSKAKAPGLAERFSGRYNLDTSKADKARAQAQNTIEEVGPILSSVGDFIDKGLGYGVGGFNDLVSTVTSGIGVALDFVGAETLADGAFTAAYDMAEGAEGMRKYGFFDNAVKSVQRGDYVESEWIESAADFITQNMPDQPGLPTKEDIIKGKGKGEAIRKYLSDAYTHLKGKAIPDDETLSAAAQRAPEHAVTLFEQGKDFVKELGVVFEGYQKLAQDTREELKTKGVFDGKTKEEKIQIIKDYVEERTGESVSVVEAKEDMMTYDQYNMLSVQQKRDLGLPTSKYGIQQITRGGMIKLPKGKTNPFTQGTMDTPKGLDVPAPSQVDTTYPSRPDFGPGIMSRMKPSELKEVDLEGAPKIGDVAFENMLERVHGGSSKIVEDFRKKITAGLKAADVTRLIKSTQGLPKTKSRDTLLMSLYDLRDALNKR